MSFRKKNIASPRTTRLIFVALLCIVIIMEFMEELPETHCSQEKINNVVTNIIKNNEKKTHYKLAHACKSGMLRGCVTGCINGGIEGMFTGGVMFGLANPIITYLSK